jgi:hypothetical protein
VDLPAGQTSVVVTHNLGSIPTICIPIPLQDMGGFIPWISNKTPTQFTINVASAFLSDIFFDIIAIL